MYDLFGHDRTAGDLGVAHADELFLEFNFPLRVSEEDREMGRRLVRMWTNFVKTFKPTEDDSWKPMSKDNLDYVILDLDGPRPRPDEPERRTRMAKAVELLEKEVVAEDKKRTVLIDIGKKENAHEEL